MTEPAIAALKMEEEGNHEDKEMESPLQSPERNEALLASRF